MISVNLLLLRRVFGPLEQLTSLIRRVEPYAPGRRLEPARADPEVADLCHGLQLHARPVRVRAPARRPPGARCPHSPEQIAQLLNISPKTVERHRENILAKLGMRDRVQLARWAIRHGLVEP